MPAPNRQAMRVGKRRAVFYLMLVFATTALFTVLYNFGMSVFEGRPQPLYRSLEVVVQSFTTTGYGEDAPWTSPWMNGLAITMQLAGIALILAAVDVFAVPLLRRALTPTVPSAISGLEGHLVVCGYTPRTHAFLDELDARDEGYVIVESDEDIARELQDSGYQVVHGDAKSTDTLRNVGISSALALVADVSDDANASIALAARNASADVSLVTLVEDANLVRYHRAAGADAVLSPRQLLGTTLAEQVPTSFTTNVDEAIKIGDDLELVELPIDDDSELAGESLSDFDLRGRFGVEVIGGWIEGELVTPIEPNRQLSAGAKLLIAGAPTPIEQLRETVATSVRPFGPQNVVLAGYGDSGQAAYDALDARGSDVTVLDVEDGDAIDVVGDARDPAVLEAAGVEDATSLIIAVGDDTTAIFTTLIARELNDDVRIIVRANQEEDITKLYHAGADYAQSLASVSGRMIASTVFEDEEVLAYGTQINVVRLPATGLVGRTLAEADIRKETGCTILAIARDDEQITGFEPGSFTFVDDDEVILAGTDNAINEFERRYVT